MCWRIHTPIDTFFKEVRINQSFFRGTEVLHNPLRLSANKRHAHRDVGTGLHPSSRARLFYLAAMLHEPDYAVHVLYKEIGRITVVFLPVHEDSTFQLVDV